VKLALTVLATLLLAASLVAPSAAQTRPTGVRQIPAQHYRLFTDVEPELARDLARRLDAMHDEYTRRFNAFERQFDRKHDVFVFARKNDYAKLVGDRLPNTGGVFMPDRNLLAVYLEGQGRDTLRRTLQHEAFHQFAYDVISPAMPVWINEGIAQLFEEGIWTGERFVMEQVPPRRLRQLQADVENGRLERFEPFVSMDHRTWARNMRDRERGATQYNQAWAMVHFLVYAVDAKGQPLYRKRFFDMLRHLNAGVEPIRAFTDAFGTNYQGFERRFLEYASKLSPTRESLYAEQMEVLSDMTAELANQGTTFAELGKLRSHLERGGYQLHYTKGELRWSSDPDVSRYFKDDAGRDLGSTQLSLAPRSGAPLPDLVLRPIGDLEYRARFHRVDGGGIEREILIGSR
jgi:hypothetical protein